MTGFRQLLQKIPPGIYRDSPPRFFMLLLLAAALALQWWTWFRRFPLIAQKQSEMHQVFRLEGEVQQMKLGWSADESLKVEKGLKQAREHLFTGETNSAACFNQIHQPAHTPALAIDVTLQEALPHPQHSDTLLVVPTLWDLKPAVGGSSDVPLQGVLLSFLQELTTNQPKRMDLVELTVNGDGKALTHAQAVVRLWFQEDAP